MLDEVGQYPTAEVKSILNYKLNYDDETEMFSREIFHLYKSGATDPNFLLANLMASSQLNDEDEEGLDEEEKAHLKELKKRSGHLFNSIGGGEAIQAAQSDLLLEEKEGSASKKQ